MKPHFVGMLLALALTIPVQMLAQGGKAVPPGQLRIDWDQVNTEATRRLAEYVRIDTTNPPGNEIRGVEWLAKIFRAEGIRTGGGMFTKTQEIENVKSGALKYEKSDIQDLKIHVYGHTAVTTVLVSFKGTAADGKTWSGTTRATRVWVKQKGTWKCVAYQATRVSQ